MMGLKALGSMGAAGAGAAAASGAASAAGGGLSGILGGLGKSAIGGLKGGKQKGLSLQEVDSMFPKSPPNRYASNPSFGDDMMEDFYGKKPFFLSFFDQ